MNALTLFVIGAPAAFWVGWWARGAWDRGGSEMTAWKHRLKRPFARLFEWFSHGNRLVAFTLFCGLMGLGAFGYTWNADQQSEDRSTEGLACVAAYIQAQNDAQTPRTNASVAASDARYAWDMAPDGPEKNRLLGEYQDAYRHYVEVRAFNPLPTLSPSFCEEARRAR